MNINEIIDRWKHISPVIREPQNEDEYDQLADLLDQLLDIVGDDESHELIGFVDVISHMIAMYDELHFDTTLIDNPRNIWDEVKKLPKAPDDFFSEERADSKPEVRPNNKK